MTVSTTHKLVTVIGDGVVDTFTFDFQTLNTTHIKAFEDGVEDLNITVVLNADQEASPGGTCQFDTAPPANLSEVAVLRDITPDQQIDYPLGGNFSSESHEGGLDKLTMLVQEAKELAELGIHFPLFEVNTSELPKASDRANKFLYFDVNGDIAVSTSSVVDPNAVQKAVPFVDGNLIEFDATGNAEDSGATAASIATNTAKIGGLNTKIVEIGDWDMITDSTINVTHNTTLSKIRSISAVILKDDSTSIHPLNYDHSGTVSGTYNIDATNVILSRFAAGLFNSINYDLTPFNRGWVTIQYTD